MHVMQVPKGMIHSSLEAVSELGMWDLGGGACRMKDALRKTVIR